jgi:hypothetical protein
VLVALVVLMAPLDTDSTYTCRGDAITTLISPEPDNPAIRAVGFDAPAACNETARSRGMTAAAIVGFAALLSGIWLAARRRAGTYS